MQMSGGAAGDMASQVSEVGDLGVILSSLANMHLGQILICFVVFFILGYMLYASLFAAIGSAVENEGDSNQLMLPVTIPLLLGFFIAIYAFKAPDSALVALLIVTFAACAWVSSKIYKVGILMFGKKSGWKDLWRWLRQK